MSDSLDFLCVCYFFFALHNKVIFFLLRYPFTVTLCILLYMSVQCKHINYVFEIVTIVHTQVGIHYINIAWHVYKQA